MSLNVMSAAFEYLSLYLSFLSNKNYSVDLNVFRMMSELFILLFLTISCDVYT